MMPTMQLALFGVVLLFVSVAALPSTTERAGSSDAPRVRPKLYVCIDGVCDLSASEVDSKVPTETTLGACRLNCSAEPFVWPAVASGESSGPLQVVGGVRIANDGKDAPFDRLLKSATSEFNATLPRPRRNNRAPPLEVHVQVADQRAVKLMLTTNESYSLRVSGSRATIEAETFFGARHGFETLSQLLAHDVEGDLVVASNIDIVDEPAHPYRGLMLDTSRHFLPLEDIRRTIRAMAASKLNSLHLHLTDTPSFPLALEGQSGLLEYGAYSQHEIYTKHDVRELTQYATERGVRLVPEIDAPAHVGEGWTFGKAEGLGELVLCHNVSKWGSAGLEPPTGQFNLANENVMRVLRGVYEEVVDFFDSPSVYHLGGDEVLKCDILAIHNILVFITDWLSYPRWRRGHRGVGRLLMVL